MIDSVSDALIRIKNSYGVGRESVDLRYSKLILNIVNLLSKEGYLGKVETKGKDITVELKYNGKLPAITDLKRVSRPALRVYKGVGKLPRVMNGMGIAIVSTPKGVMSDKQARKIKMGGEVLALVW